MGQGVRRFVRRAMLCWNTPESGGTDARTGKFSGDVRSCERRKAANKQRRDKGNSYERTKELLGQKCRSVRPLYAKGWSGKVQAVHHGAEMREKQTGEGQEAPI